ncbi:hypothetical protein [Vulcanisaeta souniana]|uniref:Uncharacterized protein n=1 Tax=Vulcanisaeta souniana JCM 11219 TaxID=1293586 RepID=A0A830E898_9CREN|nr:hypothetical protein [Vulcanisaeta souniana]BDR91492.1 hypothetical protein Vsou_05850 [Vulcanisaeta souniana JCM 11219]GGI73609.1 hypothetical protein GCM10007112_08040 [Vulcanisaeta souniana JCM 11219]
MAERLSYIFKVWAMIFHDVKYALLTTVFFIVLSLTYSFILIQSNAGFLFFGNYYVIYSIVYSLALSWALSISVAISIYSYSHRMRPVGVRLSAVASIIGIMPSLCCGAVIPMLISALGGSLIAITINGKIMGFIAERDPVIMVLALILAYYSLYLSSKRLCFCSIIR